MTREKIFEKSIRKAIDNGFYLKLDGELVDWDDVFESGLSADPPFVRMIALYSEFAKAFFPDVRKSYMPMSLHIWEYHLQEMVVSDDPIKYLEQFL